jgi:hypothetical protein
LSVHDDANVVVQRESLSVIDGSLRRLTACPRRRTRTIHDAPLETGFSRANHLTLLHGSLSTSLESAWTGHRDAGWRSSDCQNVQLKEQVMADFTALAIDSGVGDYHLNRFRIAFRPPTGIPASIRAQTLASDLIDHFPTYFKSEFATVEFGNRRHQGKPTLKFHGYAKVAGIDIAEPHNDWVVRHWADRNIGFTAQTLKREFTDAGEDGKAGGGGAAILLVPVIGPAIGLGGAVLSGGAAIHVNRMHFLAGRRSWRIGAGIVFDPELKDDVIILETAAVERFSSRAYSTADSVIGLQKKVPDIWIAFLNNFVSKQGLPVFVQTLKPGWIRKKWVNYFQLSFESLDRLRAAREFADVRRLYPTLDPSSSR